MQTTLVLDTLAGEAEAAGLFATAEECSSYAASVSNCAYELTFLFAAVCCIVYVALSKNRSLHSARKDRNTSVQSARLLVSLLIFLHYLILHMLLFLRRSFPHTAWHLLSGAAFLKGKAVLEALCNDPAGYHWYCNAWCV